MAKRKHSTALFEVITQAKPYPRCPTRISARPGLMASARQWIKLRLHPSPAVPLNERSVTSASPVVEEPNAMAGAVMPSIPSKSLQIQDHDYSTFEPQSPIEDHESDAGDTSHFQDASHSQTNASHSQTVAMAVDSQRRRISLHMSYNAAIVGSCALAVIVALAIIAGQRISRNTSSLLSQSQKSTPELRDGPAHPEVLDLSHRPAVIPDKAIAAAAHPAPSTPVEGRDSADGRTLAPTAAGDGKRYIGLNYVIIQSYASAEEKMARDAAALLNKEGISCTIETGVKGYQAITVVGLQGFDKVSTPPFKAYERRILQISAKYATNNHSYKAFTPVAKKWDKQD